MQITRINNLSSYNYYKNKNAGLLETIWAKEKHISESKKGTSFTIRGFSYPAENMVDFQVDYLYSDNGEINSRERLVCPITDTWAANKFYLSQIKVLNRMRCPIL